MSLSRTHKPEKRNARTPVKSLIRFLASGACPKANQEHRMQWPHRFQQPIPTFDEIVAPPRQSVKEMKILKRS